MAAQRWVTVCSASNLQLYIFFFLKLFILHILKLIPSQPCLKFHYYAEIEDLLLTHVLGQAYPTLQREWDTQILC